MIGGQLHCHLSEAWERGEVDVFLYTFANGERRVLRRVEPDGGIGPAWTFAPVDPALRGLPAPTFTIPADGLEALVKAAQEKAHGPAVADAVADARATRDRLLSLVERSYT